MKRSLQFLCLAATLFTAHDAFAGGLFVPLGGVRNTGRAGAGVVSTRDPNAVAYNPALIALTEGHQLLVDVEWAMLQLDQLLFFAANAVLAAAMAADFI